MRVRLIGVDYSTDPKKVGLARADYTKGDRVVIDAVELGKTRNAIEKTVIEWINGAEKVLLAIDAPFGWPKSLGEVLILHKAGNVLSGERDCLFMRKTDLWVKKNYKRPLSVGADKIARTAHAALSFLDGLRNKTGRNIPLAWDHLHVASAGVSAIEVYPAATFIAHFPEKKKDKSANAIKLLKNEKKLHTKIKNQMKNDHIFDAVLCVLAAADFVDGEAVAPKCALAKDEGWIWVRERL